MSNSPLKDRIKQELATELKRAGDRLLHPVTKHRKPALRAWLLLSAATLIATYLMPLQQGENVSFTNFLGLLALAPILGAFITYGLFFSIHNIQEAIRDFRKNQDRHPPP